MQSSISGKQSASNYDAVGKAVNANHASPKSSGSRFARLEIVDEMDGVEKEVERREGATKGGENYGARAGGGVVIGVGCEKVS